MSDQGINNRDNALSFLAEVGIPASKGDVPPDSFLPNITVKDGVIVYNDATHISDLLHEAGHLAILPSRFRKSANKDFAKIIRTMMENVDFSNPDAPEARAAIQCSDVEATAWAYAAGKYLGIPDEEIILDHQYEGKGNETRDCLHAKCYFGINGLRAAGFFANVKSFPKMERWIAA